jgi:hypothetical protein
MINEKSFTDPKCCAESASANLTQDLDCCQAGISREKPRTKIAQDFNQKGYGVSRGAFYVSASPYNLVV